MHVCLYVCMCVRMYVWGATREVDDGILVIKSWLISATEYIAIDNAPPWPGIHVAWRSGLTRPDQ